MLLLVYILIICSLNSTHPTTACKAIQGQVSSAEVTAAETHPKNTLIKLFAVYIFLLEFLQNHFSRISNRVTGCTINIQLVHWNMKSATKNMPFQGQQDINPF